ncbi:MAG: putative DNA binding domain-containing protein [Bacteroidota bacterium]|nr:hypothetical protein [Odoribacter sp.]MDP3641976.1 putative DNA binding domain-containing protein [Bacteroidota bacterium]
MDIQRLSKLFNTKYNPSDWKNILSTIFPKREFYLTPQEKKQEGLKKHENIDSILEFGDIMLNDNSRILFYEVKLAQGKADVKSRVGLRNLIHADVIPGDVDGILATYFVPDAREWRLTFISKSLYWDEEMNEIKSETHPKRYTYVLGETESTKTVVKQFQWLAGQIKNREITIQDLIKTFAVEKISNEFFEGYFHQFKAFEAYVTENPDAFQYFKEQVNIALTTDEQQKEAERLIRNFVKKLLGRIVFLYFLQKKGWLGVPADQNWGDGERNFMGEFFDGFSDKINFYSSCLVPLFFDTLNRDRKHTNYLFPISGTKVPYLNGGLFDKDPVEPINIRFKPQLFQDLFGFFDQYNFTIDENSPDDFDIGIDPEMLGQIFENLLEDNRDKGTFYTPKEVVHFMCKESLSLYISEELKIVAEAKELTDIDTYIKQSGSFDYLTIQKHASKIDQALSRVKICDPAIGSGAFPMGMVYEILRLKKELFGLLDRKHFDYRDEKLRIMKESIYGVDLDKGAVDISRLRFWLSLIVDEEEPSPLPNLDYKIMQGDSLKESFEDIPLDSISWQKKVQVLAPKQMTLGDMFALPQKEIEFSIDEKEQLKEWVSSYFEKTVREDKEKLHAQIDQAVLGHIYRNVELKENQATKLKNELETKYQSKGIDISVQSRGTDWKNWKKYTADLQLIQTKKEKIETLQNSIERPYFLWNLYFADVLQEGNKGFDIVIGNPPYGVKVDDEIKDQYNLGSKDSYGVFMSMAIRKLLKDNGVLSFIVSDTWLTIKSHFEIREQVLNYQLKKVIRLHQDCFKATVNSCIFTLVKSQNRSDTDSSIPNSPPFGGVGGGLILAADLTNISTRKEVPEFRDKLFHLETYSGQYSPQFAVYNYHQNLLNTNSNKPIIVGSPKLFLLMNDTTCLKVTKQIGAGGTSQEAEIRKIDFNGKEIELVRFGDMAEVRQGLATGDNHYYLYQNPEARGSYRDINLYRQFLLTEVDLDKIRKNELVRMKVIENGIHKFQSEPDFDTDCWFDGHYIAPYDKGGESDTDEGWLPNYHVPTNYFIDWSSDSIFRLKTLTTRERNKLNEIIGGDDRLCSRFQNKEYYFNEAVTFSPTGIYAPTFRLLKYGTFDKEGSAIFSTIYTTYELIALLASKMNRYFQKQYINGTVHSMQGDIVESNLLTPEKISDIFQTLIEELVNNQKIDNRYNYFANEQKEIDRLVYELYGLNEEDINEVETWFARRYPKLATYSYYKSPEELQQKKLADDGTELIRQLIAAGESRLVEFKSCLRYCLKQQSPQAYVEHSSFKNLAAFLNSDGGHLFVGVDDNGEILGLEQTDFATFKGMNKKDEFLKHFDNLTEKYFGNGLAGLLNVQFHVIDQKTIAVVEVKGKAPEPVILKNPDKGGSEEFLIRRNASAIALTMYEFLTYTKEHWK